MEIFAKEANTCTSVNIGNVLLTYYLFAYNCQTDIRLDAINKHPGALLRLKRPTCFVMTLCRSQASFGSTGTSEKSRAKIVHLA